MKFSAILFLSSVFYNNLLVIAEDGDEDDGEDITSGDPCAYASLLYDNRPDGCPDFSECELIPESYVFWDTLRDQFQATHACFCGRGYNNKPINHNAGCDAIESTCTSNLDCGEFGACDGASSGNARCFCPPGYINTGSGDFECTATPAPTVPPMVIPSPTPAPVNPPEPQPIFTNRTRLLRQIAELSKVEDPEDRKILEAEENPCVGVQHGIGWTLEERKMCIDFEAQSTELPTCDSDEKVPKILHSMGKTSSPSFAAASNAKANPDFAQNYVMEQEAPEYIRDKCGEEVAQAYECLESASDRAHVFSYCAVLAEGGLFLDDDIIPLVKFEELYSPCSQATLGYDTPHKTSSGNYLQGKQTKILAGAPGAPLFQCALDAIVKNVKDQVQPSDSVDIAGPLLLERCFQEHSDDVTMSYMDTRGAVWPHTGLRRGNKVLAYEMPGAAVEKSNQVYSAQCPLSTIETTIG